MIFCKTIVTDDDKLDSALATLSKDAIKDADIKYALRKIAKPLIEEIQNRTPIKTRTLHDSIGVLKGIRSKKGKPFILVGPRYYEPYRGYHAHLVEVGSEKYDVSYEGFKMIFKAYQAKEKWMISNLADEMLKLMERKIKRLGL